MKIKKIILGLWLTCGTATAAFAQTDLTGRVLNSRGEAVSDVLVTSAGCKAVRSDSEGRFTLTGVKSGASVVFTRDGYYSKTEYAATSATDAAPMNVNLIETAKSRYNETFLLPYDKRDNTTAVVGASNLNRKDFALGSLSADKALKGEATGLNVINKSGMTGEGAYMELRGIRSLVAETQPLIVINGVPYLPDQNVSDIIGGFSRNPFQALNGQDIRNITVLKGAEAAVYGSLGSNGVIMVETDQATSTDVNTRISFNAVYGFNFNKRRLPMLESSQYKSYLTDMGLTYYANQEQFFGAFTFLSDPNANNAHLYQYNTSWQDEIFRNSSTSDFLFRVEGGDNIAKYNISLGYMGDNGTLRSTSSSRYNAQINASVLVSRKFEIQANINAAYLLGNYQEQGMTPETNPMLAAYKRSPLLSPYASDIYGNLIKEYSSYNFGAIDNSDLRVSNPLAIVNELKGKNRQYDMNAKLQFIYRPVRGLTLNGMFGMYYNYNQEEAFIPGTTNADIVPMFDQWGEARNTVRVGTNHTFNMFGAANAVYETKVNLRDELRLSAGVQALWTKSEYDAAFGRNTANDYYQTLGDAEKIGKHFSGYNNKWNWMNAFATASYTWRSLLRAQVTASFDGASSIGDDADRMSLYPAAELTLMAKQLRGLKGVDFINKLNVYASLTETGNSRFDSKYGKYYYTSTPFMTIAGIVRAIVPNTSLKAERDRTLNFGVDASLWRNRASLSVGYYSTKATDVLMTGVRSSVLGTTAYYNNDGEITSKGLEASFSLTPVLTRDFQWQIGASVTTLNNKVESLGTLTELQNKIDGDGVILTRVGENPYTFYGYRSEGVFATTADASAAALTNRSGVAYEAGDMHYSDLNGDHIINDNDQAVLGKATPDFFGSVFTRLEYKRFALDVTLAYSVGNDAYNAVRRTTEAGKDFSNQSSAMQRRWSVDGQVTDIPRIAYGDKVGNNDFSDRWIEDASYIKLRDITLSYTWDKPLFHFLQGGTVFVTGQNLFTITDYLGLDPEFSYSGSAMLQGVDYAKVCAPRAVKFGVNLKF